MTTEEMLEDVQREIDAHGPYERDSAIGDPMFARVYAQLILSKRLEYVSPVVGPALNTFHFNVDEDRSHIHFIPTMSGCGGMDSEQKRELTCLCWYKTGEDEWEKGEPHKVKNCGH